MSISPLKHSEASSPTTSRRGRPAISANKRQFMRAKIASAAHDLFQTEGYSKVSMRAIASVVGCSPMTLYRYYDAKIDILRTLWMDIFSEVFDLLDANDILGLDATKRLERLVLAYIKYWLDNPEHYRIVFMAEGVTQPEVSIFIGNPGILARYTIFVEALLAAQGEIAANDLKLTLDVLMCLAHGIAHNLITMNGYEWSGVDDLVKFTIKGLLAH